MDKERLIKFLELTSSSNNGEVLSAIKKANEYLKNNNMRWEQFLNSYTSFEQNDLRSFVNDEYKNINDNLDYEKRNNVELEGRIRGLKNVIKFLSILSFVLFIIVIF